MSFSLFIFLVLSPAVRERCLFWLHHLLQQLGTISTSAVSNDSVSSPARLRMTLIVVNFRCFLICGGIFHTQERKPPIFRGFMMAQHARNRRVAWAEPFISRARWLMDVFFTTKVWGRHVRHCRPRHNSAGDDKKMPKRQENDPKRRVSTGHGMTRTSESRHHDVCTCGQACVAFLFLFLHGASSDTSARDRSVPAPATQSPLSEGGISIQLKG